MEYVDVINGQKELTGEKVLKNEVPNGFYRQSIHMWIMNDKNEILVQKRASLANKFPDMWETLGGAVVSSESSLEGAIRELKEELGITVSKEEINFVFSYRRKFDFVDVFLLNKNVDINDLTFQESEVSEAKWVSLDEYEEMIKNDIAVRSSFDFFKLYLEERDLRYERACGGLILKDGKVLMVRQTNGFCGFPKGHVEKGETDIETAIREIKEETNVDVSLNGDKTFKIYYSPKKNVYKEVVFFIGSVVDDKSIKAQEGEVEEVIWVDIDKVSDVLSFGNIKTMWEKAYNYLNK